MIQNNKLSISTTEKGLVGPSSSSATSSSTLALMSRTHMLMPLRTDPNYVWVMLHMCSRLLMTATAVFTTTN